jgi:acyl transferase domain-containing protein/NAD(P)-dependent dehydrogenase (short-subunit alcohol dehydrogenase family)/aryl carrier-like protein
MPCKCSWKVMTAMNSNKIQKKDSYSLTGMEIAVIGMSARFPGARNILEFKENLEKGVEAITFFTLEESIKAGVDPEVFRSQEYVNARGVIEDVECFDPLFFGYTPKEAETMNPQLRVFHECAWHALEDAGYDPFSYDGLIGVYAGAASGFLWEALAAITGRPRIHGLFDTGNLTDKDFLCTRVAYKLNLRGPANIVQTACSTSLVAIHQACRALLIGECNIALAGGVSVSTNPQEGYIYNEGMIMSPDGHCRAFDAKAGGTVGGDGVGVVVLKHLKGALKDNDHIYALVKGSAINNDGIRKPGYTAPSVEGQAEVIRMAQRLARVKPETINFIETHGTGTTLGDPVEIEALTLAFRSDKKGFCPIGSVKTNVGHLNSAAGIAGFIKAVLALYHRALPPSLHFKSPNPKIDFENSPFYVNTRLHRWPDNHPPLRAGVSSFGIGGTNAHVILQEAPANHRDKEGTRGLAPLLNAETSREYQLILLSAKTEIALEQMKSNLAEYFKKNPNVNFPDAAYTLQVGRCAFPHRSMTVSSSIDEAVYALTHPEEGKLFSYSSNIKNRPVIFMFPGQGAQYVNMGLELYQKEPLFQEEMNRCFHILGNLTDDDIKEILYPHSDRKGGSPVQGDHRGLPPQSNRINQTEIAQPVIFAFEYSLARLLMNWGIRPQAMIGHSIGEFTAACLAGVFSLEDALRLVVLRGKLMQQMPTGAMLSVPLPEKEVRSLLPPALSLAAVNTSSSCVVSGTEADIDCFRIQLEEKGCQTRRLHTSHAYHSALVDAAAEEFQGNLKMFTGNEPEIPYVSNLTGTWITEKQVADPAYWALHLRRTVHFAQGLKTLMEKEHIAFLEVGPGNNLITFVNRHNCKKKEHKAFNLLPHPGEKISAGRYFTRQLGQVWLHGCHINWTAVHSGKKRQRIPLPGYPFDRQRYWLDTTPLTTGETFFSSSPLERNKDITDWFYYPSWKCFDLPFPWYPGTVEGTDILVFCNDGYISNRLVDALQKDKHRLVIVKPEGAFKKEKDNLFFLSPLDEDGYHRLVTECSSMKRIPANIVYLWNVWDESCGGTAAKDVENLLNHGFYSILAMVRALGKSDISRDLQIYVVTRGMLEVTSTEEEGCPIMATVLGPVRVIPQEYPNISCKCIDLQPGEISPAADESWLGQLMTEFSKPCIPGVRGTGTVIAYRGGKRWVQGIEPVRLDDSCGSFPGKSHSHPPLLKNQGVYLVTGGLGGIGLALSEYLVSTIQAKLILTTRSSFPSRDQWDEWLSSHDGGNETSSRIRKIKHLEELGSEVMVSSADAADENQMKIVVNKAKTRFGRIHGVIMCAGLPDGGIIPLRTRQLSQEIMAPKVKGSLVLASIFEDENLDFVVLCSSLASILGLYGQVAYCAGNAFLDAFAHYQNRRKKTRWISINWDTWKRVGMAVASEKKSGRDPSISLQHGLFPQEGMEIFRRILFQNQPQVVVSTVDLNHRIKLVLEDGTVGIPGEKNPAAADTMEKTGEFTRGGAARPELTTPYVPPRNEIERQLTSIWQDFLGFDKIGINDDFFQLGGDSIKAIQAAVRLNRAGYKLQVRDIFLHPTIKQLAHMVGDSRKDAEHPAASDSQLHRIISFRSSRSQQVLTPCNLTYRDISIEALERLNHQWPIEDIYPLSPMQEGMFFHSESDKDSAVYFNQVSYRIRGNIDISLLQKSINLLFRRHDILRPLFIYQGFERPLQVVLKERQVDFYQEDLRGVGDTNEKELIILRFRENDRRKLFDLSKDVLMRLAVFQLDEKEFDLTWSYHHILLDGWCLALLYTEFFEIYNSILEGRPHRLAEAAPYKNYIRWLETQDKKKGLIYWENYLQNYQPFPTLPETGNQVEQKQYLPGQFSFEFDTLLTGKLNKISRENNVTLNILFLCLWGILLLKYNNCDDVIFGSVVSGRSAEIPKVENIIGLFINTIPIRIRSTREQTFRQLLHILHQDSARAKSFEYLPLVELLENSPQKQSTIDHIVAFQNFPFEDRLKQAGSSDNLQILVKSREEYAHTNYNFNIIAIPGEQFSINFKYNSRVFKENTIRELATHLKNIINTILENQDIKIKEIQLLSPSEQKNITSQLVLDLELD